MCACVSVAEPKRPPHTHKSSPELVVATDHSRDHGARPIFPTLVRWSPLGRRRTRCFGGHSSSHNGCRPTWHSQSRIASTPSKLDRPHFLQPVLVAAALQSAPIRTQVVHSAASVQSYCGLSCCIVQLLFHRMPIYRLWREAGRRFASQGKRLMNLSITHKCELSA